MSLLANCKPIVRNTFWDLDDLDSDTEAEELPFLRPRSCSDPCIHYTDLDGKVDDSDISTVAGTSPTSCAGSVVDIHFDFTANTSSAGSVVGSDESDLRAEIMSGPPGVFAPPGRFTSSAPACQVPQAGDAGACSVEARPSTAVMVRNIPSDASRAEFLAVLDSGGFAQLYNFVYVPMNFQKGVRLGYAIINFVEPTSAAYAVLHLSSVELKGNRLKASLSESKQSLSDLILKYRDSTVMHFSVPDEYKPVIFAQGTVVPFPAPSKVLEPPSSATKNNRKRM